MLAQVYATAFPSVCVSVSHACFVSKRLNISSKFFHHLISPSFYFFVTEGRCVTQTASPQTGAPNTRCDKIGRFLTNKSVYLGNGARRYSHSCYRSRIGNHTQPIEWWPLHSTPLTGRAIKPQRQGHVGGPIAQL